MKDVTGVRSAANQINEAAQNDFIVSRIISEISGAFAVRVVSVNSPDNELINVTPMLYQQDAAGNNVDQGIIYSVSVFRMFCGNSAIIMRPVAGDIGYCIPADRDISILKKLKNLCKPGSKRRHGAADSVYMGGLFNPAPTQYIEFIGNTTNIVSPGTVSITAPNIHSAGDWQHIGKITTTDEITAIGTKLHVHTHSDPQGGNTGQPNP